MEYKPIECPQCKAHNPRYVKDYNFFLCGVCDHRWYPPHTLPIKNWDRVMLCHQCLGLGLIEGRHDQYTCKYCIGKGWA